MVVYPLVSTFPANMAKQVLHVIFSIHVQNPAQVQGSAIIVKKVVAGISPLPSSSSTFLLLIPLLHARYSPFFAISRRCVGVLSLRKEAWLLALQLPFLSLGLSQRRSRLLTMGEVKFIPGTMKAIQYTPSLQDTKTMIHIVQLINQNHTARSLPSITPQSHISQLPQLRQARKQTTPIIPIIHMVRA